MEPVRVAQGTQFLRAKIAQSAPLSQRLKFLEEKGLNQAEIDEALRNATSYDHEMSTRKCEAVRGASFTNAAGLAGLTFLIGIGVGDIVSSCESCHGNEAETRCTTGQRGNNRRTILHTSSENENNNHQAGKRQQLQKVKEWNCWCSLFERIGRGRKDGKLPRSELFHFLRQDTDARRQLLVAIGIGHDISNYSSDEMEALICHPFLRDINDVLGLKSDASHYAGNLLLGIDQCVDLKDDISFPIFSEAISVFRDEYELRSQIKILLSDDTSWLNSALSFPSSVNDAEEVTESHSATCNIARLKSRLAALDARSDLNCKRLLRILIAVLYDYAKGCSTCFQSCSQRFLHKSENFSNDVHKSKNGPFVDCEIGSIMNSSSDCGIEDKGGQINDTAAIINQGEDTMCHFLDLIRVLEKKNEPSLLQKGLPVLLMYCSNAAKEPKNSRMRRVFLANRTFVSLVKPLEGALEFLDAVGFKASSNGTLEWIGDMTTLNIAIKGLKELSVHLTSH